MNGGWRETFHLAARLLLRDWRAGELTVLVSALLVAVTAMTGVAFLTDRVGQAVELRAAESLAGDLRVDSAACQQAGGKDATAESTPVKSDGPPSSREVEIDYQIEATFDQFAVSEEQWVVLAEPLPAGALLVISPSRSLADGLAVEAIRSGGPAKNLFQKEPSGSPFGKCSWG